MKTTMTNVTNIVPEQTLREIQKTTLQELTNSLINSFGPNGSTTCIKKDNLEPIYTKDGYNILKNIQFNGVIEQSIKDDIESILRHIVTTVGDGTTSAVILSEAIFSELCSDDTFKRFQPADIIRTLNKLVDEIKKIVLENGVECTVDDIYDIAMISTNGNTEVATNLRNIYEEYGMSVFIDVAISNGVESKLKIYDGLTINTGFDNSCYINSPNNECKIKHPHIYFFEDPIDTPEMATFLDIIIGSNILKPLNAGNSEDVVPTVVFAPTVSRDLSATVDYLTTNLATIPNASKPPLLLVSAFNDMDTYIDIMKLCGGRSIRKYIDPKLQETDILNGRAPSPENICEWCGSADEVVSDTTKTKIINPSMRGTELYKNIIATVEGGLEVAKANGENAGVIGGIKRRLNALKGNMVEYLVGGITIADRDSVRDLVEDAVKNVRSASINGVGYGANFEAYNAANELYRTVSMTELENTILKVIISSYTELITNLFMVSLGPEAGYKLAQKQLKEGVPVNLKHGSDMSVQNVKSSIESDIIILDAVSRIVGIMFTTNQFLTPTPLHNVYVEF